MSQAVPGLAVVRVESDADLEAMIDVRAAANPPGFPRPRIENLRHNLNSNPELTYVVARLDGEPAGGGFVEPKDDYADGHCAVVPALRRRGIGSALFDELARRADRPELQGEVSEGDAESRAFLERRGYRKVGGEKAVSLDLVGYEPPVLELPEGIELVTLADRPDLADALYPIGVEGDADIPGADGTLTFERWRALSIDRPSLRHDLQFIALDGGTPVGYSTLNDFGSEAHHSLTAVLRSHRRRGIATAMKRAQIAAAKEAGFERLVTESEERNVPMRTLNAQLGYLPDPKWSSILMRGPAGIR
jgi:GNAT superfamily N-acetyltransferase